MRLNEAQELFRRTMLAPPEAVKNPDAALAALFSTPPEVLPERLEIYRTNVVSSLTDAMLATYPLVMKLTGEEFATAMMRSCMLANPPREACLARYGDALSDFIGGFTPAAGLPYLSDVARLEWAMNEAHYAADDAPLTVVDLQGVPADRMADLNLRLRSSARLVSSRWPLKSIRDFCQTFDEEKSGVLDLEGCGCHLLVFRPDLAVEAVSLEPDEFAFLESLTQDKSLGAAIQNTMKDHPAFDLGKALQRYLVLKTFRSLHD
jgi:hypothetical protein